MSVLQKEDWKGILDLVTNAKQFVSSVQDVARRLSDYTKFRKMSETSGKFLECQLLFAYEQYMCQLP